MPSMIGILISVTRTSGRNLRISSMPSLPLNARATTLNPASLASIFLMTFSRMIGSSSTTTTLKLFPSSCAIPNPVAQPADRDGSPSRRVVLDIEYHAVFIEKLEPRRKYWRAPSRSGRYGDVRQDRGSSLNFRFSSCTTAGSNPPGPYPDTVTIHLSVRSLPVIRIRQGG